MPHCVDHVESIEKEIPECFFNVSECFWQPVVIIIIDRDRDSDIDIDRQLMAPFGLPQFPLSLSLCHSVSVSLPPLARQPRVCLSPAIAAVQMAPGISIIYRL